MTDKFKLHEYLIENQVVTSSENLTEGNVKNLYEAFVAAGINPAEQVSVVHVAGHNVDSPVHMSVGEVFQKILKEKETTGVEVYYDLEAGESYTPEELELADQIILLSAVFDIDAYEYIIAQ